MMSLCLFCRQDLERECINPNGPCAKEDTDRIELQRMGDSSNTVNDSTMDNKSVLGRPRKPDDEVTWKSTGRRRANKDFPVNPNEDCEWKGLANCGGGNHPIAGCISGKQTVNHHGPDKDVLNNAQNNIHRICPNCHNRWHAANDRDYDPNSYHSPILVSSLVEQFYMLMKWSPEILKEIT